MAREAQMFWLICGAHLLLKISIYLSTLNILARICRTAVSADAWSAVLGAIFASRALPDFVWINAWSLALKPNMIYVNAHLH